MGESVRARIVRAAQSDELREVFRQLAEIDGPEGPRFPRRVLVDLAARIVGRAYEPMLLELAHLARAALLAGARPAEGWRSSRGATAGTGFEWLFWGVEEARTDAFRAAFSRLAALGSSRCPSLRTSGERHTGDDALVVGDEAVTLVYPDGRFEVRYARMTSLAAMMELLVSVLGYRTLVAALDPLAVPALQRGAVSGAARSLARRLYAWLADHLPAAQAQRKFRVMTAFLEEAYGPDFTEADIDDEAVLRFWLRHAVPPPADGGGIDTRGATTAAGDFRGFRTTFLAFVSLLRVLEAGAALGRFERRVPIGPDGRAGEVDPAAGRQDLHGMAEDADPLARLQETPADVVKVLNRRELALLALPVRESEAVRRLPRSWLRTECFGPVQNRLSQALRRRAGAAELAALATAVPDPGYRGRIEALEKTAAHLARAARACLYVLHGVRAVRRSASGWKRSSSCVTVSTCCSTTEPTTRSRTGKRHRDPTGRGDVLFSLASTAPSIAAGRCRWTWPRPSTPMPRSGRISPSSSSAVRSCTCRGRRLRQARAASTSGRPTAARCVSSHPGLVMAKSISSSISLKTEQLRRPAPSNRRNARPRSEGRSKRQAIRLQDPTEHVRDRGRPFRDGWW